MILELQGRINEDPVLNKVSILGVDPGTMSTGLQRYASWFIRVALFKIIFPLVAWLNPDGTVRTTQKSASHVLQAAFDACPGRKGQYYNGTVALQPSAESRDPRKREMVWRESIRYAHLERGETILSRF